MNNVHICSFQAGPDVTAKLSYEDFRAAVLKAGRFSVYEASDNRRSRVMYSRLCGDPTIKTSIDPPGFPWTAVREKEAHQ